MTPRNDSAVSRSNKPDVISYRSKPRLNLRSVQTEMNPVLVNDNHEMARFIMALRSSGLRNMALMSAFEHTTRASFFESIFEAYLYQDMSLPLPCGQEASSAHFIARVLGVADIKPHEQVLEIGTGSGYQTALLGLMAKRVVSLERYRTLATLARKSLSAMGLSQIDLRVGDGLAGYDLPQAHFDCILINGAVTDVPETLMDRLLPGGRIVFCADYQGAQNLQMMRVSSSGTRTTLHGNANLGSMKSGRAIAL